MIYTYIGVILEESFIKGAGINEIYESYLKRVPRFLPIGKYITDENLIKKEK